MILTLTAGSGAGHRGREGPPKNRQTLRGALPPLARSSRGRVRRRGVALGYGVAGADPAAPRFKSSAVPRPAARGPTPGAQCYRRCTQTGPDMGHHEGPDADSSGGNSGPLAPRCGCRETILADADAGHARFLTPGRTADHACANWNARFAGRETFTINAANGWQCAGRCSGRALCAPHHSRDDARGLAGNR